jgi:hypothetical protein
LGCDKSSVCPLAVHLHGLRRRRNDRTV